jgi:hypothetical protein
MRLLAITAVTEIWFLLNNRRTSPFSPEAVKNTWLADTFSRLSSFGAEESWCGQVQAAYYRRECNLQWSAQLRPGGVLREREIVKILHTMLQFKWNSLDRWTNIDRKTAITKGLTAHLLGKPCVSRRIHGVR